MAVLQRQYSRPFPRPAAPPVPRITLPTHRTRSRTFTREAERARQASLLACLVAASLLVLYIAGHARMTAANYQRVKILSQIRDLRAQNKGLQTEIFRMTEKAAVADWAKRHGMILDSRDPVSLSR